jgi:hypothetical protein
MNNNEICATCRWNAFDREDKAFICSNTDSVYCGDWTQSSDTCEFWEVKE